MTDANEILKIQINENVSYEEAKEKFEMDRAHRAAEFLPPPRESKPPIGGINEQVGVD